MMRRLGACAWLLLCTTLACNSTGELTQIMVVVRSDIALDSIAVETLAGGVSTDAAASLTKHKLPRTLAVVRRGGSLGPVTIIVRGFIGADSVVERRATLSFVEGQNVRLVIDLESACLSHAACKKDNTCIAGTCKSAAIDSAKLPTWNGKVGSNLSETSLDGGSDGSLLGADAGPDAFAGDGGAGGNGVCDDVHVDCNADSLCETRIDTATHCGSCKGTCKLGVSAAAAHATLSCATRTCVATCKAPAFDIDEDPTNGCEFPGFAVPPAHVDPFAPKVLAALAPALVVDCVQELAFGMGTVPANVDVCSHVVHPVVVAQTDGPDIVVVPVMGLKVEAGKTLTLTGGRPVLFLVFGDATIAGEIDASALATTSGPGGDVLCSDGAGAAGGSASSRGGGGGGGSFGPLLGAKGGNGYSGGGQGALAGMSTGDAALAVLQGGCPGGRGGAGQSAAGLGGGGGGAVQLSVSGTLSVEGTITAVGGGGRGSANGNMGGGGGGGSGGAVFLEATTMNLGAASWVTANGGGGGEASSDGSLNPGAAGASGAHAGAVAAVGGSGGAGNGGDGGKGAAGVVAATVGGNGSNPVLPPDAGGGGGGGGGAGRIVLRATACALQGGVSPAATSACSL